MSQPCLAVPPAARQMRWSGRRLRGGTQLRRVALLPLAAHARRDCAGCVGHPCECLARVVFIAARDGLPEEPARPEPVRLRPAVGSHRAAAGGDVSRGGGVEGDAREQWRAGLAGSARCGASACLCVCRLRQPTRGPSLSRSRTITLYWGTPWSIRRSPRARQHAWRSASRS